MPPKSPGGKIEAVAVVGGVGEAGAIGRQLCCDACRSGQGVHGEGEAVVAKRVLDKVQELQRRIGEIVTAYFLK